MIYHRVKMAGSVLPEEYTDKSRLFTGGTEQHDPYAGGSIGTDLLVNG